MKVFFDGKIYSQQRVGGISRVGFELMKELGKKSDIEQIFYRGFYIDEYSFEKQRFSKYFGLKIPEFLKSRAVNFIDNIGSEIFYRLNAKKDLIYHSFFYRVPKNPKGPVVVHCHDMIHELFNGNQKAINFKKKSFDKADLIIAVSESTKNDLCKIYQDIDPKKVVVINLGISDIFFKENNKLGLNKNKRPHVLYVGPRNYKYKNFDLLLDAFIENKYYLDFDLVIFGGEKELSNEHKQKINKTQGAGSWLLQKKGDDKDLAELYAGAEVFVYPSLYEGFGIPPLEAMASGCAVLASNASSIPEVVGNAGLLFDPNDKEDLKKKLNNILRDKSLSLELVKRGRERAKQFTWPTVAEKIYKEYLKFE